MNQRTLFLVLAVLVCGSVALFLLSGEVGVKETVVQTASVSEYVIAGVDESASAPAVDLAKKGRSSITQGAALPNRDGRSLSILLAEGTDEVWLQNYPSLLSLPAFELWKLLERPEIQAQPQAKLLMEKLMGSCAVALSELYVNVDQALATSQPLNRTWCQSLQSVPPEKRGERAMALSADPDIVTLKTRLPNFQLMQTDVEKTQLLKQSQQVLDNSHDPFLLSDAVRNLVDAESDAIMTNLRVWNRLPKSQKDYVNLALQAMTSCEALSSCGPNSLLTVQYCGWMPGLDCQNGMGLHQIVQNSLSPNQMQILNAILTNIRQRRSAPSDP